jgi:hypothetical protein
MNGKDTTACILTAAMWFSAGCSRASGDAELLGQFAAATCVPPSQRDSDSLHRWREEVTTASGLTVEIRGINDPTGRIDVNFGPSDSVVAVDPGDFFAPTEVRLDKLREQLLVKAEGASAMGGGSEIWLFRYDLQKRELLRKAKIDLARAPKACPPQ